MLILQGVPPLGVVQQGGVGKTSYFRSKCVNISKSLGEWRYIQNYYIYYD